MPEDPTDPRLEEARDHHRAGRLADAERLYRRVLEAEPDDASVLSKLGAALAGQRRLADARAAVERALDLDPRLAEAHNNLGLIHLMGGDTDAAAAAFEAALAIDTGLLSAHLNLGNLHRGRGRLDDALQSFQRALAVDPDSAEALNGLGAVHLARGRTAEAADAFRRALALDPGHAEAVNNLGTLQAAAGDLEDAEQSYRRALEVRPDLAAAHVNLGNALKALGRLDEAAASLERAIELDGNHAEAHWNYAQVLLLQGRLRDGWAEYEWRSKCREFQGRTPRFDQPRWDGAALDGGTILVHAEQGFGDAIQFFRYLPQVAAMGGTVVFQCAPQLVRLFEGSGGAARVVSRRDEAGPFDVHAPLMSLPHVFGTAIDTVPDRVPYVRAPEAPPLAGGDGLKVGIVWAGNPDKKVSKDFSVALARFRPLLDVAGCAFYSLQVGHGRDDIQAEGLADTVADLGRDFDDFAATAAALERLDLVISVDTAVAHLAGAMGRPAWTLLAHVPDWRWLMARADSPWYPTMRLFRQPARGDWDAVFAEARAALVERVSAGAGA